jgi:GMP synthase (glutamine-hydrolysing)
LPERHGHAAAPVGYRHHDKDRAKDHPCYSSPRALRISADSRRCSRAGHAIRYHDIDTDDLESLEPNGPGLMVVLGRPVAAYRDERYPFVRKEGDLLTAQITAGQPPLGICLGAQFTDRALGAPIHPGSAKELGFAPFQDRPVLHGHGDVLGLPEGAVQLASTAACENQAFAYGRHAIGFQFHPEAGGPGLERWLEQPEEEGAA